MFFSSLTFLLSLSLSDSIVQWMGFFGCVSYEVFGDFMSIAELEHCILRNGTHTILHSTVQCSAVQYSISQYSTVQYITVLRYATHRIEAPCPVPVVLSIGGCIHTHPSRTQTSFLCYFETMQRLVRKLFHLLLPSPSLSLFPATDMSRPKVGIFAKHIIPQTRFAFALQRKDVRLLWAINCGSYSMLPMVPIYEPHLLEQQLDAVMRCAST